MEVVETEAALLEMAVDVGEGCGDDVVAEEVEVDVVEVDEDDVRAWVGAAVSAAVRVEDEEGQGEEDHEEEGRGDGEPDCSARREAEDGAPGPELGRGLRRFGVWCGWRHGFPPPAGSNRACRLGSIRTWGVGTSEIETRESRRLCATTCGSGWGRWRLGAVAVGRPWSV